MLRLVAHNCELHRPFDWDFNHPTLLIDPSVTLRLLELMGTKFGQFKFPLFRRAYPISHKGAGLIWQVSQVNQQ